MSRDYFPQAPLWHYEQATKLMDTVVDHKGDSTFTESSALVLIAGAQAHAIMGLLSHQIDPFQRADGLDE